MMLQNQIMKQQMKLRNTEVLKFNLCDYNSIYILVRSNITSST